MGMMTRRNVKQRAVKKTAPVNVSEVKEKNFLDEFAESMNTSDEKEEVSYTKTEINRMSTAELKELATSKGIDGAENMTGGELKRLLIEKFGL